MRRFPHEGPDLLNIAPPARSMVQPAGVLRLSLPLTLITPQVGGGVEPHQPDEVTPVRLSAVRGQLRQWWRWLFLEHNVDPRPESAHRDEVMLWGGVLGDQAFASRVRLRVEAVRPGEIKHAGKHEINANRQPKSMPTYSGAAAGLEYALFPLQASREQLLGQAAEVPTKPIRTGLSFTLVLEIGPRAEQADQDLTQVLAALWTWTQFGGLGARTRRGLGAVALSARATLQPGAVYPSGGLPWERLFAPMSAADWRSLAPQVLRQHPGSRAAKAELWVGPACDAPAEAHRLMVGRLKKFRQGPGQGRAGDERNPGRSYWPEANLLRATRDTFPDRHPGWEHPPPETARRDLKLDADRRLIGAPRATFGLPLEVQFKGKLDSAANASILPADEGKDRMASPLILRPVRLSNTTLPVMLKLPLERTKGPLFVRMKFKDKSGVAYARVQRSGGAEPPVAGLLHAAKGHAVNAFLDWMQSTHHFQRIP